MPNLVESSAGVEDGGVTNLKPSSNTAKPTKRSYSKNGCQECKRRKLKCDEAKPHCVQCSRLGKECIYAPPKKILGWNKALVFTPVEFEQKLNQKKRGIKTKESAMSVAAMISSDERPYQQDSEEPSSSSTSYTSSPGQQHPGQIQSQKPHEIPMQTQPQSQSQSHENSHESSQKHLLSSHNPHQHPLPTSLPSGPHKYDSGVPVSNISELASVLNNLLTWQMDEVSAHYSDDINIPQSADETFLDFLTETENHNWNANTASPSGIEFLQTQAQAQAQDQDQSQDQSQDQNQNQNQNHNQKQVSWGSPDHENSPSATDNNFNHSKYLQTFSSVFCWLIMPFLDENNNTLRYYLLSYAKESQYLMAALLSSGARIAARESSSKVDERAHYFYLSYCLKLLASCLVDETNLAQQTEPMLLTVLVLTSDCACSFTSSWRAHLRGAKDLLKRFFNSSSQSKASPVVVLCTMWFASIDMLASVSAPYGGTLQNDDDLDEMSNSDQADVINQLQKLHIISDQGYNRFLGYKNECLPLFKRLIRLTWQTNPYDAEKCRPKVWSQSELEYEVHNLFQDLRKAVKLYEISPNCIVPSDFDLTSIPKSAYGEIEVEPSQIVYYSWLDIVHQGNLQGALILLLTTPGMYGLPPSHELVQDCVNKNLQLFIFLNDMTAKRTDLPPEQRFAKLKNSYSLMMTQWFLFITGKYAITTSQRQQVRDVFLAVMNFGKAQSANVVLQELERLWTDGWKTLSNQTAGKVDLLPY